MLIRPADESDRSAFVATILTAFGAVPENTEADSGHWWSVFEMDRSFVAEADGRVVGTAGAYSFDLTLPGGIIIPVAGVTAVGVLPSHRRQGILTTLMRRQLATLRTSGEAVAVLLASEAVIYRRFGYGPATFMQQLTVQRGRAALAAAQPDSHVTVRTRAECGDLLPGIYDAYQRVQPGAVSRPAHWWTRGAGRPPVAHTPRLIALHHDESGAADGYVSYQVGSPDPVTRARVLTADELIAASPAAAAALFRFCVEHDLVTETVFGTLPPDTWLRWLLRDYRAAAVTKDHDWLWVRLLDIPRALDARDYCADGEVVLEVRDTLCEENAGRYALSVHSGRGVCTRTDRDPDLALDVSDLGSLYLGGLTATFLQHAGRIQSFTEDGLRKADGIFRSPVTPHTVHWF
jgi:predicted acetyltransferase